MVPVDTQISAFFAAAVFCFLNLAFRSEISLSSLSSLLSGSAFFAFF